MKKFLLLLSLLAAILPTRAQHVRNKPFDPTLNPERLTPDEIIRLLGKPEQIDSALIDDGLGVFYPDARFYFYESYDPARPEKEPVYVWDGFETESPDFCILSDCFPGGIKVGDRLEGLKQLDFVHTRYGKGRAKNGLRLTGNYSELDEYSIFGEEYDSFYLHVKDGIVQRISWVTPEDWGRIEGGLLWKISGDSLPAPSYILGTFPNAPAGFRNRIKGLDKALIEVKAVYREDPELGPWSRKVTAEMYLPGGGKLEDLYEWDEYVDIQDYVKKVTGFRPETLEWSPDGLTRFLLSHLLEQALPELAGAEEDLAAYIDRTSREEGKEVHLLPASYQDIRKEAEKYPRVVQEDTWDLLRLVWYPEGEPGHVKERIRHLYNAWQAQDLGEITYSLMEEEDYSPLTTNIRCNVEGIWLDELREAMDKGPVLIVVDCSGLNYLLYCLSNRNHRIKSLR